MTREWQVAGGKPCPGCGEIMEDRKDRFVCWNVKCDVIRTTPIPPEILRRQTEALDTLGYN